MSSSGRASSRLIASTEARGRAELLGLEQLQRVQRRGDVAAVDLEELAVAVVERVRAAAFSTFSVPITVPW